MTRAPLERPSLSARATALKGVGPARAARLARLGVERVRDLLLLAPRRLATRGACVSITEARASTGREVSVRGRLRALRRHRGGRGRSLVRARLEDGEASIDVLFFNQPWQHERLGGLIAAGAEVELSGRVAATRTGPALATPRLGTAEKPLEPPGELLCVYPSTEGLGQPFLRAAIASALAEHADLLAEPLPAGVLARLGLPPLPAAVRELHAPSGEQAFLAARRRAALEAMLELQAVLAARRASGAGGLARPVRLAPAEAERLFEPFGFAPTRAQRRALDEVLRDLARERPMRRLLQGDVGAGKTAVGVAAAVAACRAGGQAALLAPTELLAEQHHAVLAPVLARAGLSAALLTGSLPARERRAALARLARGEDGLAVGTHALLSPDVRFRRLDLAVIDEQQRFGVEQRRALLGKGEDVHMLLMTATPIPRTLALTLYGDLATSLLDERPPGRLPVATRVAPPEERAEVVRWLGERLGAGERAYWVAPRIEPALDEDPDAGGEDPAAAEEIHARLARELGAHGVELVHGRLPRAERAARVERFRRGEARLLVGTTVIEVGVDVPEATVLVVDGAERFGLAQLHQLRGRVGRGTAPSACVLIARGAGAERCRVLEATADGFAIAEEDLRRRGMGELAGLRQSGEGALGSLDADADVELLLFARDAVADPAVLAHYLARARGAPEPGA